MAEEAQTEKEGWTRSLGLLPRFDAKGIYDRIVRNSTTMPKNGAALNDFSNKKQGCKS